MDQYVCVRYNGKLSMIWTHLVHKKFLFLIYIFITFIINQQTNRFNKFVPNLFFIHQHMTSKIYRQVKWWQTEIQISFENIQNYKYQYIVIDFTWFYRIFRRILLSSLIVRVTGISIMRHYIHVYWQTLSSLVQCDISMLISTIIALYMLNQLSIATLCWKQW